MDRTEKQCKAMGRDSRSVGGGGLLALAAASTAEAGKPLIDLCYARYCFEDGRFVIG